MQTPKDKLVTPAPPLCCLLPLLLHSPLPSSRHACAREPAPGHGALHVPQPGGRALVQTRGGEGCRQLDGPEDAWRRGEGERWKWREARARGEMEQRAPVPGFVPPSTTVTSSAALVHAPVNCDLCSAVSVLDSSFVLELGSPLYLPHHPLPPFLPPSPRPRSCPPSTGGAAASRSRWAPTAP